MDYVKQVKVEDVEVWIQSILFNNPIELSVVGDIDADHAQKLVATYLGSLKNREKLSDINFEIADPRGDVRAKIEAQSNDQRCLIFEGWNVAGLSDKDGLALFLGAKVASTRLFKEIREKQI